MSNFTSYINIFDIREASKIAASENPEVISLMPFIKETANKGMQHLLLVKGIDSLTEHCLVTLGFQVSANENVVIISWKDRS